MNKIYDSIIIGAGISGMTAAIYLKRYGLDILMFEKEIPGGQISKASLVENYPGFKSIDGMTLSTNLLTQVENLGLKINYEEVKKVIKEENFIIIETDKNSYKAKTIVIATGRKPIKLNIDSEKYIGNGISYCATCDGMFYKNKDTVVVGGGNSALEESLYLSNICNKVIILNRSDKIKADEILLTKVKEKNNIEIHLNTQIKEIINEENKIKGIKTNNDKVIYCSGIFIYIGLKPNTDFIDNINTDNGYIKVNDKMETNIKGIYAVGDVTKKSLYQLVTATSDGAIAANEIKKAIIN